ncbi:hypothetical protein REPUB_Repub19eG0058800 [Reevesia pubescens]
MHKDLVKDFIAWQIAFTGIRCDKTWRLLFFAISWSIWLMRNEIFFDGNSFDLETLIACMKFRFVAWAKPKWPNIKDSGWEDIWSTKIVVSSLKTKKDRNEVWTVPVLGTLNFNIDGASAGNPRPSWIGGALMEETSVVLLVFSKSIGLAESFLAELLALKEGFLHFAKSRWNITYVMLLECDNTSVVS